MRQAAGQLAHRLHLLAVLQSLLQRFARGAIKNGVHHAAPGDRAEAQLQRPAIGQPDLLRFAGIVQISRQRSQQLLIVDAAMKLPRRDAEQFGILRVPHHQLTLMVKQGKAVAHRQKGGLQLAALLFQQA